MIAECGLAGVTLHIWSLTHGIANLFSGHENDGLSLLPIAAAELPKAGPMFDLQSLGLLYRPRLTQTCVILDGTKCSAVSKALLHD